MCASQRAGLQCTDTCCFRDEENPSENVCKGANNNEDDENMDAEV